MGDPLLTIASFGGLLVAFALLRLWPFWTSRERGCDAYYFLLSAEAFRRRRRLPVVLPPLYLLESEQQDYPPGFSVLLGLLPARWLERNYWVLTNVFDSTIMLGLSAVCALEFGLEWGILAGLAYSASPFLVLEYASLTSRAPAAMLFMIVMVATTFAVDGSPLWLVLATAAALCLLFTHKLSVQLLWSLLPFLAVARWEWEWLVPLSAAYGLAFASAPRLFARIQRAHWDVIGFWARNWRYLGAHQVRDSPLYGPGRSTGGYHRGGIVRSNLLHARRLLRDPFILVVPVALLHVNRLSSFEILSLQWIVGTYAVAILTLAVPFLRGFGEGTKYVKYAVPPTLFLAAGQLADEPSLVTLLLASLATVATGFLYVRVARDLRHPSEVGIANHEIAPILHHLGATEARVMCLPLHLADLVAFLCRRPVLWGSHHYSFDRIEPLFPVLRRSLRELAVDHRLSHLLLDTEYATLDELGITASAVVDRSGRYVLCTLDAGAWLEGAVSSSHARCVIASGDNAEGDRDESASEQNGRRVRH